MAVKQTTSIKEIMTHNFLAAIATANAFTKELTSPVDRAAHIRGIALALAQSGFVDPNLATADDWARIRDNCQQMVENAAPVAAAPTAKPEKKTAAKGKDLKVALSKATQEKLAEINAKKAETPKPAAAPKAEAPKAEVPKPAVKAEDVTPNPAKDALEDQPMSKKEKVAVTEAQAQEAEQKAQTVAQAAANDSEKTFADPEMVQKYAKQRQFINQVGGMMMQQMMKQGHSKEEAMKLAMENMDKQMYEFSTHIYKTMSEGVRPSNINGFVSFLQVKFFGGAKNGNKSQKVA